MIEEIKKLFIPKHTPYCYQIIRVLDDGSIKIKHCKYWRWKYSKEDKCKMEYCKYLKEFLSIQDEIKDCDIK